MKTLYDNVKFEWASEKNNNIRITDKKTNRHIDIISLEEFKRLKKCGDIKFHIGVDK